MVRFAEVVLRPVVTVVEDVVCSKAVLEGKFEVGVCSVKVVGVVELAVCSLIAFVDFKVVVCLAKVLEDVVVFWVVDTV